MLLVLPLLWPGKDATGDGGEEGRGASGLLELLERLGRFWELGSSEQVAGMMAGSAAVTVIVTASVAGSGPGVGAGAAAVVVASETVAQFVLHWEADLGTVLA